MTKDELQALSKIKTTVPHVSGLSLFNRTPRTFMLFQRFDKSYVHVYFDKNSVLHKLTYTGDNSDYTVVDHQYAITFPTPEITPLEGEALFAKNSDYEFCKLVISQGFNLEFNLDDDIEPIFLKCPEEE